MSIEESDIVELRKKIKKRLSQHRYEHTVSVEKMAEFIGGYILPDKIYELRAAALLHDISKEIPMEEQIDMLKAADFSLTDEDLKTTGIIHSFTAPLIIKRDFSDFSSPEILQAVLCHTVGSSEMSVFDKIIFLSDYIEESRIYQSCIDVRERFLRGFEELSIEEKILRLNSGCKDAMMGVFEAIKRAGRHINSRMFLAINSFTS